MPDSVNDAISEEAFYRKKMFLAMIIPGIFITLMWLVKITELLLNTDLSGLGIYPLSVKGLAGVIFSPFIHSDLNHLFNNSLPLFLLSTALFFFYSEVALKVFFWTWFLTGMLVWFAGREAWHIGASGLVYGLASFLFFSGIIRRHFRLIALSLLIVFLYGSMVWGLFPGVYKNVSWESHMLGFFSGVVLALWFRNEGPQRPVYDWMEGDEDEDPNGGDGESGRESETKRLRDKETQIISS
jgi:membrane associated rhomboid family serine protease